MEVNREMKSVVDKYDWYRYSPRCEYNDSGDPELPPEDWLPSIHLSGFGFSKVSGGPNDEVWYLVDTSISLQHGYLINVWFNREAPYPENPLRPDQIPWHWYNLLPTAFLPGERNVGPSQPPTPRPIGPWKDAIINHESYGDQGTVENANGHHARCVFAAQEPHFAPSYRQSTCCDAKEYLEKVVYWDEDPGVSLFGMLCGVLGTVKEGSQVENNLNQYTAGDMHNGIRKSNNIDPIGPDDPPVPLVPPNWPLVGYPDNYVYCVNFYVAGHWWDDFSGGGDL